MASIPIPSPVHAPVHADDPATLAASGRRVFEIEAQALSAVASRIDGDFSAACRLILASQGRVVCTGMGKSGHVARKIAATLATLTAGAGRLLVFFQPHGYGPLAKMGQELAETFALSLPAISKHM